MRKITTLTISLLMVFILPAKALLGADTGQADRYEITKVTDGDSLRSGELRIRLHGMDAPEIRQSCTKGGVSYACGLAAQAYLETMLASSGEVRCEHLDTDRYQRLIMRCYHRGIDIAAAMVRAGWAVAYRRYSYDYVADEQAARDDKIGLWEGTFQTPEAWRRDN